MDTGHVSGLITLSDRFAFVVFFLPFCKGDFHFCLSVFEIYFDRNERETPFLHFSYQPLDFVFVQKELPLSQRVVVSIVGMGIRADMCIAQIYFSVFYFNGLFGENCVWRGARASVEESQFSRVERPNLTVQSSTSSPSKTR